MPAHDDWLLLETQSERLGVLWRSQGQAFLDEQAVELQEDVDRLRDAYVRQAPAEPAPSRARRKLLAKPTFKHKVIDLREPRDPEIQPGWICSTDGHFMESATARCSHCQGIFCRKCILQTQATHGKPLCLECALVAAGISHKRIRPLVASGRTAKS